MPQRVIVASSCLSSPVKPATDSTTRRYSDQGTSRIGESDARRRTSRFIDFFGVDSPGTELLGTELLGTGESSDSATSGPFPVSALSSTVSWSGDKRFVSGAGSVCRIELGMEASVNNGPSTPIGESQQSANRASAWAAENA